MLAVCIGAFQPAERGAVSRTAAGDEEAHPVLGEQGRGPEQQGDEGGGGAGHDGLL
jgi:hypothetical protein